MGDFFFSAGEKEVEGFLRKKEGKKERA